MPRYSDKPAANKKNTRSHSGEERSNTRSVTNAGSPSSAGRSRPQSLQRSDDDARHSAVPIERPAPKPSAAVPSVAGAQAAGADETIRLNKVLSSAGICSRRAADELILQGAIAINGQVVTTPGVKVTVGKDVVTLNGVIVSLGGSKPTFTYILMNKPVRVVTTVKDPQGRTTVMDLLPDEMKNARLFPVGRLDFFSEGLLLLTDDGDLTYRLTHPKWHLPKVYRVRIRGKVPDAALKTIRSGMTLAEGERLAPVKVNVLREEDDRTTLEMHLIQGVNRQIRRMCRDLDLTILSLKRFRHGPIDLGSMDRGKARYLDESEIALLRRATGLE